MAESILNKDDMEQCKARGITSEQVMSQIEKFKKGLPYLKLHRPCTVGDGITRLERQDLERLGKLYSRADVVNGAIKFVPASGAASRMFKTLVAINNRHDFIDEKIIEAKSKENDPEYLGLSQFAKGLKQFAFFDDLKTVMSKDGHDIEDQISKGHFKDILEYLLTSKGFAYAGLPKGLIKFHYYPDHSRTPFEEHLVEALDYTKDRKGNPRIHFTVSARHEMLIRDHIDKVRGLYETSGRRFTLDFSIQKSSTDTIAVDMDNKPFRDRDGKLVFRPGGHGALIENLNDIDGGIVFVKNIDNIVPDRLKQKSSIYKKAFGGYLMELQKEIFGYLDKLAHKEVDERLIKQIFEFARARLSIIPPEGIEQASKKERVKLLYLSLNRPLRICGMVKNEGEPGGGPFWVEDSNKVISLQIVEASQVDMESTQQSRIWKSSTHFNPVDLVCGVRDYLGNLFDLRDFVDPERAFISTKFKDGRELKALELPGLWNGAMAYWNTVFVEMPLITFNPVKTINDLLRTEHQDGKS
ncbi:MAG: DUF4301 family protein [Desulfobacterales bacterium]|nr:DUF4301 family protein [Desulfobacterales bacterium]